MSGKFKRMFKSNEVCTSLYSGEGYEFLGVAISMCVPDDIAKKMAKEQIELEIGGDFNYEILDKIEANLVFDLNNKSEKVKWFEIQEV